MVERDSRENDNVSRDVGMIPSLIAWQAMVTGGVSEERDDLSAHRRLGGTP